VEFAQRAGVHLLCSAIGDANGNVHRLEYAASPSQDPDALPEPRYIVASGGQVLQLVFADSAPQNDQLWQPTRRLIRVDHVSGLDDDPANQLAKELVGLPTVVEREARLHHIRSRLVGGLAHARG